MLFEKQESVFVIRKSNVIFHFFLNLRKSKQGNFYFNSLVSGFKWNGRQKWRHTQRNSRQERNFDKLS